MAPPPLVLSPTPPLAPLIGSDVETIYLAGALQLGCPGQWGISEPSLAGPSISHRETRIPPSQLSALPMYRGLEEDLSPEEKADSTAWTAYIDENLTDLVNLHLYSLPLNYAKTLFPAQAASLSFPTTHYAPQRVRGIHKARLEHVGLWGLGGSDTGEQDGTDDTVVAPGGTVAPRAWAGWRVGRDAEKRRRAYSEEQLLGKARAVLDPLVRRLRRGSGGLFFSKPSFADLRLYAHLALLLEPTWPNTLLPDLIRATYPSLVEHHSRLRTLLFPTGWTVPTVETPTAVQPSIWDSLTGWPWTTEKDKPKDVAKSKKEKEFARGRLLWFAGAAIGMVTYLLASGMVQVQLGPSADDEEEEEEEETVVEVAEVEAVA